MRGDGRSRRIAVVPDSLANPLPGAPDGLAALAADGWGVAILGAPDLVPEARTAWRDAIVEQIAVYLADGYEVALVRDDAGESDAFEQALRAAGHAITRELQAPL